MQTSSFHSLTLVSKTREYGDVFSLDFEAEPPVSWRPGQYVHLLAPASPPGRENVRHLSIASIPEEGPLKFSVDLGPSSDYKRKLAALEPGGRAHLFKVKGEFVLSDPPPSQVVFLAGGLGITPIRALLLSIVRRRLTVAWRLAHVARQGHLYETELAALGGLQRRVGRQEAEQLVRAWVPETLGALWYVSGSHGFVEAMGQLLVQAGVHPDQLRVEDFS